MAATMSHDVSQGPSDLVISLSPGIPATRREIRSVRHLANMAEGHFWFLPIMAVLAVLSSLFEGISLALIIPLIEALQGGGGVQSKGPAIDLVLWVLSFVPVSSPLIAALVAIIGALILKNAISYLNVAVLCVFYGRLSHALRIGVFRSILNRPLAELEREPVGRFLNVLTTETWRATDAINSLFTIVTSTSTIVVFLTLLFLLSWQLSAVALACTALIPPLVHLINMRVKRMSRVALAANEALAQQTWSSLNALRTIHICGRSAAEVLRFQKSSDLVRRRFLRMALISAGTAPVTEVLVSAAIAVIAVLVSNTGVGLATLVGFLAILLRLQPRILALVSAQANLLSHHGSVVAVGEALAASRAPSTPDGGAPFTALRDGIQVRDLTLLYPGTSRPVLSDVSLTVKRGTMVAIVGSSGSGKSTLLDVLLGFQRPTRGEVLVDATPLSKIDLKSWRSRISVVDQDPYVFDDTIGANIRFGADGVSNAAVIEAARLARADEFIRQLPSGYDTVVGERGTQISGGQRQRIALARALVRDPEILLLDEATNALDRRTEDELQVFLKSFARSRTVIFVSHRIESVLHADLVVMLEDGRVVERGTPGSLIESAGPFASLFAAQRSETVPEDIRGDREGAA
ncbi:MAG: ABC transporter ATP-binding protein [Mesorhizobium sp.]|nr:MAG: ABC transporter ATP-binding protein [Mesorhizobium sp.]